MTALRDELGVVHPSRQRLLIGLSASATLPGLAIRILHIHLADPVEAWLFGVAIVGAAFMLSWAAETAQMDISAGLAIAVLALIAVFPEYAVDLVFAAQGGDAVQAYGEACRAPGAAGESSCSLALANMTGANRLLIGIGWSMVAFIAWYRRRHRRGHEATHAGEGVLLGREHSIEVAFLATATVYSLTLPLKHSVTLVDAAVLAGIFALYTIRVARGPNEPPHLVGPARYVATFSAGRRRATVTAMFIFAALVILVSAERFAGALVDTGLDLGISEFLLVQWLAPLASETPELLVAGLFAWRLNTEAGLGTLVSSKVNQWTLLVGTLPLVFSMTSGGLHGLPIETRQREELFLTAAQSLFAVAVIAGLSFSIREAWLLFVLFWAQFIIGAIVPSPYHGIELIGVGVVYLLLSLGILLRDRSRIPRLLRDGFLTAHDELHRRD